MQNKKGVFHSGSLLFYIRISDSLIMFLMSIAQFLPRHPWRIYGSGQGINIMDWNLWESDERENKIFTITSQAGNYSWSHQWQMSLPFFQVANEVHPACRIAPPIEMGATTCREILPVHPFPSAQKDTSQMGNSPSGLLWYCASFPSAGTRQHWENPDNEHALLLQVELLHFSLLFHFLSITLCC